MGLPKEIYTYGLLHKHEQIFRCSLKRNKKEEADEEFLVYVRSNVCMLQKEKVCYWSQYSSFPHILQGSSAQCIRHSCYPWRYRGWLVNKVEKSHLKSFSSSVQYSQIKQIFTEYTSPHISKHVFLHWKEAKDLLTLNSAVKFFFCRLFVGMYFVGALRYYFITCTY